LKDNPEVRKKLDAELRKHLGLVKPEPAAAPAIAPAPTAAVASKAKA